MKKVIRLTESDLIRIVKKVVKEQYTVRGKIDGYCRICDKVNVGVSSKAIQTAKQIKSAIDVENYDVPRYFTSFNSFQEFCSFVKAFKRIANEELFEYLADEYGRIDDENVWDEVVPALADLYRKYKPNDKNYKKKSQTQWKPGGNYNWK